MGSDPNLNNATEKGPSNAVTTSMPDQNDAPADTNAKSATNEETLPGWTIMRPLKMQGLKGKGSTKGKESKIHVTETSGANSSAEDANGDPLRQVRSNDELLEDGDEQGHGGREVGREIDEGTVNSEIKFKVYKRRWFGLVQLVLLNIIVSWDWLTFSANSTTAAEYYNVTSTSINWLSTGFLFAFVVASPLVIYTLHRGGPKPAIMISSVLILLGNWIRYAATRSGKHGNFGGLMFGQILIGFGQPFVLSAPTRYSDLWFTNSGRIAATAVMSLANPLGGALAQLIDPAWIGKASDIPNAVLYVSIIATIATIPSFFIPAGPPTPSSHSGTVAKHQLRPSLQLLFSSPEFYMIMIPFIFYVALFNSISSLINQMLQPYSFSEDDAGIGGALLIVVGLVTSAITSPILDRTKSYLIAIKIQVPIIALSYLAFTWAPQTRTLIAPYVILSILGAASFSLVPVALEYLIEITHPVAPEVTSTICWTGGQLLGGIFIIVSDVLRAAGADDGTADDHTKLPPGNMHKALIFQAVVALVVVPLPLALGCFGRQRHVKMRRVDADREAADRGFVEDETRVDV